MEKDIFLDRLPKLLIGPGLLLAFGGILFLTIDILRDWWYLTVPGWSALIIVLAWRSPMGLCFNSDRQTLEIKYPLGNLLNRNETYSFSSIVAIQSFPRVTGENLPEVALEIVMHDGGSKIIESAAPDWASHGPLIGLGRCREPQNITLLRQRIAALVGMENRGFLGNMG